LDAATIAIIARPVFAALFALLAAFGISWATDNTILNASVQFASTAIAAALVIWSTVHTLQQKQITKNVGAQAFSDGSQPNVQPVAPTQPAAIAAASRAIATVKAQ
jgi:hypothetical protein